MKREIEIDDLGKSIMELRKVNNLSRRTYGELVGIESTTVYNIEKSLNTTSLYRAEAMFQALGYKLRLVIEDETVYGSEQG